MTICQPGLLCWERAPVASMKRVSSSIFKTHRLLSTRVSILSYLELQRHTPRFHHQHESPTFQPAKSSHHDDGIVNIQNYSNVDFVHQIHSIVPSHRQHNLPCARMQLPRQLGRRNRPGAQRAFPQRLRGRQTELSGSAKQSKSARNLSPRPLQAYMATRFCRPSCTKGLHCVLAYWPWFWQAKSENEQPRTGQQGPRNCTDKISPSQSPTAAGGDGRGAAEGYCDMVSQVQLGCIQSALGGDGGSHRGSVC